MSNIYGRQVVLPLVNKSGGGVIAGDTVIIDTSNDGAFTTSTAGAVTGGVGIAQETIANNATGRILMHGYAALVNTSASVTRGNYGKTHTVAKQTVDAGASRVAGAFCQFLTGGTTPTARVFSPDLGAAAGNVASDAIWDAAGDLAVGTGADTAAKLSIGATNGMVVERVSGAVAWALPPGYEFDYAQTTSIASITATTEATANTVVTAAAVTYDGSTVVMVECNVYCFGPNVANQDIQFALYDGSSSIGVIGALRSETANRGVSQLHMVRRLTPSAAAHTYSLRAWGNTGGAGGGAGGVGNTVPGFIRQTKV